MATKKTPATKKSTFGTCRYSKMSPGRSSLSPESKAVNIHLSFEEALKFNLAVDECVRKLNSYKRSTTVGKKAALNLTVYLGMERIAVNEGKL